MISIIIFEIKLGFVAVSVILTNGRLKFKGDVRSEGLLYCVSDETTKIVETSIKGIDMFSCLEPNEI